MKLRIKGNSLRLRITKSDLELLKEHGHITETTQFIHDHFSYRLQQTSQFGTLQASLEKNSITVFIPDPLATSLLTTDQVGYNHTQDNGTPLGLFILVEKDFKCLDATWEDQSDMWDNPNDACQPVQKTS